MDDFSTNVPRDKRCVSVVLRDAARAERVVAVCAAAGWCVGANGFVALVDARDGAGAKAIRARDPLLPIVAVGGGVAVVPPFDDLLRWPARAEAVEAMIAIWCPVRRAATLARLRAAFGDVEVDGLIAGLLAEARAGLDGAAPGAVHRIAGLAGTLGLTDVARTWQRWSDGDAGAEAPARRAALRALRDLG